MTSDVLDTNGNNATNQLYKKYIEVLRVDLMEMPYTVRHRWTKIG